MNEGIITEDELMERGIFQMRIENPQDPDSYPSDESKIRITLSDNTTWVESYYDANNWITFMKRRTMTGYTVDALSPKHSLFFMEMVYELSRYYLLLNYTEPQIPVAIFQNGKWLEYVGKMIMSLFNVCMKLDTPDIGPVSREFYRYKNKFIDKFCYIKPYSEIPINTRVYFELNAAEDKISKFIINEFNKISIKDYYSPKQNKIKMSKRSKRRSPKRSKRRKSPTRRRYKK